MSTPDLQLLKLAFAYHMVEQIIGADARIDETELAYLERTFPTGLMAECGFVDPSGALTQAHREAADLAIVELPAALTEGEKLAVLEILVEAGAADGVLTASEAQVLAEGARLLQVPQHTWLSHMRALVDARRLRVET